MSRKNKKTVWAFDCETDPFKFGRMPVPFLWCAVSEFGERVMFWGDDATEKFIAWIQNDLQDALLLGHNAGKFDALFLKSIIEGEMLYVDGRIISCMLSDTVEMRDSFAVFPMALKLIGAKLEIDIDKLERDQREKHKTEIIVYCFNDCIVLMEKMLDFYERAGKRRLTIASQSSHELRTIYPDLPKIGAEHDAVYRPFFFGGRVQAIQKGVMTGNFKLFDVNSMYPSVMAHFQHPFGQGYTVRDYSHANIPDHHAGFFYGTCDTRAAFPVRQADKSTPYTIGNNINVHITIHEVIAALECGAAKNFRGKLVVPDMHTDFSKFVHHKFALRQAAKASGDAGGDLYNKLILNSSYGRFAMSPDGRDEHVYLSEDDSADHKKLLIKKREGYSIKEVDLDANRYIIARPVQKPFLFYEDVATGASITGAARAELMRGLYKAVNPLYCDTDSIICEDFSGSVGSGLGQWKLELTADTAAIGGKKMYAMFENGEGVKKASKGVRASYDEILRIARGEVINFRVDAPTMRLHKNSFIERNIKNT